MEDIRWNTTEFVGAILQPFEAWLMLQYLETLSLRMERHSSNAQAIAEWLVQQPGVARVHFPGLEDHPQRQLVLHQQQGPGGIISFELEGGRQAAWDLIDRQGLMSITANLGDAKTTITHPATTTHGRVSDADKARAGITPGLVRISAGLENVEDLIAALERGLK